MIIPSMPYEPRHIHQGLLRQYLPIAPPSDLHHLTFVPDLYKLVMKSPTLQQAKGIFTQSKTVAEPKKFVDFLDDSYMEASVVHGHGASTTPQARTDNDHCTMA